VALNPVLVDPNEVAGPVEPRSIEFRREDTRSKLAYFLVGIFAVEVAAALISVLFSKWLGLGANGSASVKDILSVVFSPTVALVGSAIGFYFANEGKKHSDP
jgi:hypothetical protein